ncbi:MAG: NUDIX hydrolase, partial [Acidimicrobiales bacterium]
MTSRGGPQIIPRPEEWRAGAPAPWSDAALASVSLSLVRGALADRGPGLTHRGGLDSETPRSAVLVPLYEIGGQASVILTRRSPNLRSHTHQVSFPGGRVDPTDVDPWATAVREADEEIALDPRLPTKIGELDSFVAGGSQTFVTPLVAE